MADTVTTMGQRIRQAGLHPRRDATGNPDPYSEPPLAGVGPSIAALKAGASGKDGVSPLSVKLGGAGAVNLLHRPAIASV
eukprot:80333-Chlamydomonas_euryale.AAC.4